jgi:hypothetical protein
MKFGLAQSLPRSGNNLLFLCTYRPAASLAVRDKNNQVEYLA